MVLRYFICILNLLLGDVLVAEMAWSVAGCPFPQTEPGINRLFPRRQGQIIILTCPLESGSPSSYTLLMRHRRYTARSTCACRRPRCTTWSAPPQWGHRIVLVSPSFHERHGCGGQRFVELTRSDWWVEANANNKSRSPLPSFGTVAAKRQGA